MSGRVLQVVGLVAGGAGRHVHELVVGLVGAGWRVGVACPAPVEQQYAFADAGADVTEVEIADRPQPADLRTVRRLRAAAAEAQVVHAHGLRAGALVCLGVRRDVPVVVTLHNAAPAGRLSARLFGLLTRVVARRADVVLAVSPDLERLMRARGARDVRAAVVAAAPGRRAGRLAEDVRRELGDPALLALTVARLAEQKGLDALLDAAAAVDPELDVLLAVAGDGPLRDRLQERVGAEGLPVVLLGRRDDVPDLMAAADLALSAARWEGQPVWLQEALQAGLPVVATDAGGTAQVLGGAGLLVPPGDATALAAAITRVCGDDELRRSLAAQAVSRAERLPDRDAAVAAAVEVYESLVRGTARDDVH